MCKLYDKVKYNSFIIAGPCVMESYELMDEIAFILDQLKNKYPSNAIIFKSSFDKANRTSINSRRGPGIEKGLDWLGQVKQKYDIPVTTDIHEPWQAEIVNEIVDIIQIPAFLCRQTDLLIAASKTHKIINIKKAQFLGGEDMVHPVEKVKSEGNNKILLTERGTMFGYNNLVVDFRNIPIMKETGFPVIMDCTHSVQRPGASGGRTGGNREFVPAMAQAAKAFGADGYFFEIHPDPDNAMSDGPNMVYLDQFEEIVKSIL